MEVDLMAKASKGTRRDRRLKENASLPPRKTKNSKRRKC
jgi:hypothetical protein